MLQIDPIPAFDDNYIWTLYGERHAVVVDPGEAAPVLAWLNARQRVLSGILCTHHHGDHVGGIAELCAVYNVPVYAPRAENIAGTTNPVAEGDSVTLPELDVTLGVMDIRGHTRGHVGYLGEGYVFCGDTLFGCGCGRLFEGSMNELHHALQRLAALPDDTRVYCAHEYTESNIRFALVCEPDNASLQQRADETHALRATGRPSVPSTIALEKATNPFLRCAEPAVIRAAQTHGEVAESGGELAVFSALRRWKDHFRA